MKKATQFIIILLLTSLILIGAGCGEKLDKKLSETEIKNILTKTAQNLGWGNIEISTKETDTGMVYSYRNTYNTELGKYVNISIKHLSDPDKNNKKYAKYICEQMKNKEIKEIVKFPREMKTKIIDLLGFDACYYDFFSDYDKQCETCANCSRIRNTAMTVGDYWLSVFSHIVEYQKGSNCIPVDPIPISEKLTDNLLQALRN